MAEDKGIQNGWWEGGMVNLSSWAQLQQQSLGLGPLSSLCAETVLAAAPKTPAHQAQGGAQTQCVERGVDISVASFLFSRPTFHVCHRSSNPFHSGVTCRHLPLGALQLSLAPCLGAAM